MASRVAESDVGDDLALTLDLFIANLASVFTVVIHQMLSQALAIFEYT